MWFQWNIFVKKMFGGIQSDQSAGLFFNIGHLQQRKFAH